MWSIVDSEFFPLPAVSTAPSSALIIEQSRHMQSLQVPVCVSLLDLKFIRFMIAAFQDLAREPNQEASEKTAAYLIRCLQPAL